MIALDLWRDYIMKSHDDRTVRDLLHPDAVFESPVVHTPQRGRDIVFKYDRRQGDGRSELQICRRVAQ